jgi:acetyl esterase/lipase
MAKQSSVNVANRKDARARHFGHVFALEPKIPTKRLTASQRTESRCITEVATSENLLMPAPTTPFHATSHHRKWQLTTALLTVAALALICQGCDTPPTAPPLPVPQTPAEGIESYKISIEGTGAGRPMNLIIYLPTGQHEPKSLPCVFIAAAGGAMYGTLVGDGSPKEHYPYVMAGFAVVAYDVSGPLPDLTKDSTFRDVVGPIRQFIAADGGLVNAQIAIDYALKNVAEIDSERLYSCGHSSAANQALNLASAEPRIRACCAYAPITDVEEWWHDEKLERELPELKAFATRKSPLRHIESINCPVFLFHADDDSVSPLADNEHFAEAMRAAGKRIEFDRVPTGDHYNSMITRGIPDGINSLSPREKSIKPAHVDAREMS